MYQKPASYYRRPYDPQKRGPVRKPIRSFRDLEVYQNALDAAVVIAKNVYPPLVTARQSPIVAISGPALNAPEYPFLEAMLKLSLKIPRFIAEAHSLRFDFPQEGFTMIERARFSSNRMVVYLEQVRDIYGERIDRSIIQAIIQRYMVNRTKLFRLSAAWQRAAEAHGAKNILA